MRLFSLKKGEKLLPSGEEREPSEVLKGSDIVSRKCEEHGDTWKRGQDELNITHPKAPQYVVMGWGCRRHRELYLQDKPTALTGLGFPPAEESEGKGHGREWPTSMLKENLYA